jgi:transcriptional regulator with XRE-family HTH domain
MANEPKQPPKPKTPRKPKTPNVVKAEGAPAAPAPAPETPKRGRPTKWADDIPERMLELAGEGKSRAQIAKAIGISRQTWTRWESEKPEFSDAVKEAQWLAQAWWEDRGQAGITAGVGGFNATAYIFQMKNRFRDDYRDQQDHNVNPGEGFAKLFSLVGSGKADALLGGNQ